MYIWINVQTILICKVGRWCHWLGRLIVRPLVAVTCYIKIPHKSYRVLCWTIVGPIIYSRMESGCYRTGFFLLLLRGWIGVKKIDVFWCEYRQRHMGPLGVHMPRLKGARSRRMNVYRRRTLTATRRWQRDFSGPFLFVAFLTDPHAHITLEK